MCSRSERTVRSSPDWNSPPIILFIIISVDQTNRSPDVFLLGQLALLVTDATTSCRSIAPVSCVCCSRERVRGNTVGEVTRTGCSVRLSWARRSEQHAQASWECAVVKEVTLESRVDFRLCLTGGIGSGCTSRYSDTRNDHNGDDAEDRDDCQKLQQRKTERSTLTCVVLTNLHNNTLS